MTVAVEQIVNYPFLYKNGLQLSNDATTPNTILDIAVGQCRDSSDVLDMFLNTAATVNFSINGAGGLDTGSIAASKLYYIYVIADVQGYHATSVIASLAIPTTGPLMPFGYGAYRWIGCCTTDSSSHILAGYWAGNAGSVKFVYDVPQATAITAGTATTYTAIDLSALVPNLNNTPVDVQAIYTPAAASHTLKLQPVNGTGDGWTFTGQVTSVILDCYANVLAQIASSKPEISYKVSNNTDAVAINIQGYSMSL